MVYQPCFSPEDFAEAFDLVDIYRSFEPAAFDRSWAAMQYLKYYTNDVSLLLAALFSHVPEALLDGHMSRETIWLVGSSQRCKAWSNGTVVPSLKELMAILDHCWLDNLQQLQHALREAPETKARYSRESAAVIINNVILRKQQEAKQNNG